jgi:hypothetical protein
MIMELLVCAFCFATRTTPAIPGVEIKIEISVKPKFKYIFDVCLDEIIRTDDILRSVRGQIVVQVIIALLVPPPMTQILLHNIASHECIS